MYINYLFITYRENRTKVHNEVKIQKNEKAIKTHKYSRIKQTINIVATETRNLCLPAFYINVQQFLNSSFSATAWTHTHTGRQA